MFHARDRLAERFLLCNGDSLFDCNLARLLADAADDGPEVVGRMVLRRIEDASRYGVVELDGDRVSRSARARRPARGQAPRQAAAHQRDARAWAPDAGTPA